MGLASRSGGAQGQGSLREPEPMPLSEAVGGALGRLHTPTRCQYTANAPRNTLCSNISGQCLWGSRAGLEGLRARGSLESLNRCHSQRLFGGALGRLHTPTRCQYTANAPRNTLSIYSGQCLWGLASRSGGAQGQGSLERA